MLGGRWRRLLPAARRCRPPTPHCAVFDGHRVADVKSMVRPPVLAIKIVRPRDMASVGGTNRPCGPPSTSQLHTHHPVPGAHSCVVDAQANKVWAREVVQARAITAEVEAAEAAGDEGARHLLKVLDAYWRCSTSSGLVGAWEPLALCPTWQRRTWHASPHLPPSHRLHAAHLLHCDRAVTLCPAI